MDDVFFADLSKQICLLIMDDDEDSLVHSQSVHLQACNQTIHPSTLRPFINNDKKTCKRESKGTGVFIPRSSSLPRRKNAKQGRRSTASGSKFQRPSVLDSRRGLSHMA